MHSVTARRPCCDLAGGGSRKARTPRRRPRACVTDAPFRNDRISACSSHTHSFSQCPVPRIKSKQSLDLCRQPRRVRASREVRGRARRGFVEMVTTPLEAHLGAAPCFGVAATRDRVALLCPTCPRGAVSSALVLLCPMHGLPGSACSRGRPAWGPSSPGGDKC